MLECRTKERGYETQNNHTCNCICAVDHGRVCGADAAAENLGTRNGHGSDSSPLGGTPTRQPLELSLSRREKRKKAPPRGHQSGALKFLEVGSPTSVHITHVAETGQAAGTKLSQGTVNAPITLQCRLLTRGGHRPPQKMWLDRPRRLPSNGFGQLNCPQS